MTRELQALITFPRLISNVDRIGKTCITHCCKKILAPLGTLCV